MGYLHETDLHGRDSAEMMIPAFRSTVTPRLPRTLLESDCLPKGYQEELVPLGPAIHFQFHKLDDETYVMASFSESLPEHAEKAIRDLLLKVQARYPETGPSLHAYQAERKERRKEELRRQFGDAGSARGADIAAAVEGGPGTATGDAKVLPPDAEGVKPAAQPPTSEATIPKRRRGRIPTDPKEKNLICAEWLKVQYDVRQDDFCNRKGISSSLLRSWLKDYPCPES